MKGVVNVTCLSILSTYDQDRQDVTLTPLLTLQVRTNIGPTGLSQRSGWTPVREASAMYTNVPNTLNERRPASAPGPIAGASARGIAAPETRAIGLQIGTINIIHRNTIINT